MHLITVLVQLVVLSSVAYCWLETENVEIPALPYSYQGLEPFIDEVTMKLHHTGHHATYAKNLNVALDQLRKKSKSPEWPPSLQISLLKQLHFSPCCNSAQQLKTCYWSWTKLTRKLCARVCATMGVVSWITTSFGRQWPISSVPNKSQPPLKRHSSRILARTSFSRSNSLNLHWACLVVVGCSSC